MVKTIYVAVWLDGYEFYDTMLFETEEEANDFVVDDNRTLFCGKPLILEREIELEV